MPIRMWGTIAIPASAGPHPVVVLLHEAHGDDCPAVMDANTWPCWKTAKRSDLGFRSLVRALAAAGFVAGRQTSTPPAAAGEGEGGPRQSLRIKQVVDTIKGKADIARTGVLGHSQGGRDALGRAKGNSRVRSLFLLAPAYDPAQGIPMCAPRSCSAAATPARGFGDRGM
jgi:dienelactone hydrolase